MNRRKTGSLALVGVLLTLGIAAEGGDFFIVDAAGGGDFSSIQPAIDAALDGMQILVADGVYTGAGNAGIDFKGKRIVLKPLNDPGSVTLDGQGAEPGPCVHFHTQETTESVLQGIAIRGFRSPNGALFCEDSSSPSIRNCTIAENVCDLGDGSGGGVRCIGASSPAFEDCTITSNLAGYGGGIACSDSFPSFLRCKIIDNEAKFGSGGGAYGTSQKFESCTFRGNRAGWGDGGGAYLTGTSILRNCIIAKNTAVSRGGGISVYAGSVIFEGCRITGNLADIAGGGVDLSESGTLSFINCTIDGNIAGSEAGAIAGGSSDIFDHCTVVGNFAGEREGGVACGCILKNSILWDNVPDSINWGLQFSEISYSCIDLEAGAPPGPGNINSDPLFYGWGGLREVFVDGSKPPPGDGTLESPFADLDSALQYDLALSSPSPCIGVGEGGTDMGATNGIRGASAGEPERSIHVAEGTYSLVGINLSNNVSLEGAGEKLTILKGTVFGLRSGAVLSDVTVTGGGASGIRINGCQGGWIHHSTITGNFEFWEGGGVSCRSSSPLLEHCTISGNSGRLGGGFYSYAGEPILRNCRIVGNMAGTIISIGTGGGVFVEGGSHLSMEGCEVFGNLAHGGGGIYIEGSYLECITNCTVSANRTVDPGGWMNAEIALYSIVSSCIENCILWGNGSGLAVAAGSPPTVSYSLIQGDPLWPGEGNKNENPLFHHPGIIDFNRFSSDLAWGVFQLPDFIINPPDLDLSPGSPAIDGGKPGSPQGTDILGRPRPMGGRVDMGAYEYPILMPQDLLDGIPSDITLSPSMPGKLFKIVLPAGAVATIQLLDPSVDHLNFIYGRWGQAPTELENDASSIRPGARGQSLLLRSLSAGAESLYILVKGLLQESDLEYPLSIRIDVSLQGPIVESIEPSPVMNNGSARVTIRGSGFNSGMAFSIVPPPPPVGDPVLIAGSDPEFIGPDLMRVTFNLDGAAPGLYDLDAEDQIHQLSHVRWGFFEVLQAPPVRLGPVLEAEATGAAFVRPRSVGSLNIRYRNSGDEPMVAPLLKVTAPEGIRLRPAGEGPFGGRELLVLACPPGSCAAIPPDTGVTIPPGGEGSVPIFYFYENEICPGGAGPCLPKILEFAVSKFRPGPDSAIAWDALSPPVSPDLWSKVYLGLAARMGPTWEEYRKNLGLLAARLFLRGGSPEDAGEAFRFALALADGRATAAIMGTLRDEHNVPMAGECVEAIDPGQPESPFSRARTDGGGRFVLQDLEPGIRCRIRAAGLGVETGELQIPIDGDLLDLELFGTRPPGGPSADCPEAGSDWEDGLSEASLFPPEELFVPAARALRVAVVSDLDPSSKVGPGDPELLEPGIKLGAGGADSPRLRIGAREEITYTIHFANDPGATAPVRTVEVDDRLSDHFDLSTLRPGAISIGQVRGFTFDAQPGNILQRASAVVAAEGFETDGLRVVSSKPLRVRIGYEVNPLSRSVKWTFAALDAESLEPVGAQYGFLPPSTEEFEENGEVSITFSVFLDVSSTYQIQEPEIDVENLARIAFGSPDRAEIRTATVTIDLEKPPEAPTCRYPPDGAAGVPSRGLVLEWNGGPSASSYDVYFWRCDGAKPSEPSFKEVSSTVLPPIDFEPSTQHCWTVVARNDHGIAQVEVPWKFTTAPADLPPCPEARPALGSPKGGVEVPPETTFQWDPPKDSRTISNVSIWREGGQESKPISILGTSMKILLAPGPYRWKVAFVTPGTACGGLSTGPASEEDRFVVSGARFFRGDFDGRDGIDITDPINILNFLFTGGKAPGCLDAADADDSGELDISDAISLLSFLFLGGGEPAAPGPRTCGFDPTPDALGGCDSRC